MERFTEKTPGGAVNIHYPRKCFFPDGTSDKIAKSAFRQNAIEKLCAYEDTGLEPEEIYQFRNLTKMIPLDRLRELAQADKEGRCEVLPAKMVFVPTYDAGPECDLHCPIETDTECCELCEKAEKFIYEFPCKQEHIDQIGKTVFLTREEAEKALGGGQNEPLPEPPEEE